MGLSSLPAAAGLSYNRVVFLSSGTFTLPKTAFNKFDCVLVSGGGGGGGANNTTPRRSMGGSGAAAYFHDIFCSNETTLTVTVGAGGTGSAAGTQGGQGNESTVTGLAGNGASTSLSSGSASGGKIANGGGSQGIISPQVARNITNNGGTNPARSVAAGWGFGVSAFASGQRYNGGYPGVNLNIFGSTAGGSGSTIRSYINGATTSADANQRGGTGGPIPLLGNLLHAAKGSDGSAGQTAGGLAVANTYFAGTGGGSEYGGVQTGLGGGGGAGGQSNNSGIASGNGGAGSANSGGGGGAGGQNQAGGSLLGTGANGGSGFVVIGYWG
jgi:hypothetical protein